MSVLFLVFADEFIQTPKHLLPFSFSVGQAVSSSPLVIHSVGSPELLPAFAPWVSVAFWSVINGLHSARMVFKTSSVALVTSLNSRFVRLRVSIVGYPVSYYMPSSYASSVYKTYSTVHCR